jgi:PadR family transcriptional regulator, regulatory protein PadR
VRTQWTGSARQAFILRLTEYTDDQYLARVRLPEPTFFILTALADQPLHGYGVMLAVRELSDGRLNLRPGTLYAALDRLAEDGLLAVDREEAVDGRLRRYYRLTDPGAAALHAEVEQLRANARIAAGRLRRRGAVRLAMAGAW